MSVRTMLAAAGTVAGVVATILAAASPAQAASGYGCNWPEVCFYQYGTSFSQGRPEARYRDMGYQGLSKSAVNANYAYNSRNDDGARLYFFEAGEMERVCVPPNTYVRFGPDQYVYAIEIVDPPYCS